MALFVLFIKLVLTSLLLMTRAGFADKILPSNPPIASKLASGDFGADAGGSSLTDSNNAVKGPRFTYLPSSSRYFLNTLGTTLDCVASSPSKLTYNWLTKSELASEIIGYREKLRNGSLFFPPFNPDMFRQDVHDTEYFCEVGTDYGTIISYPIKLKALISTEQRFTVSVEDVLVPLGSNVRLSYSVSPNNMQDYVTTIQWLQQPNTNNNKVEQLHDGSLFLRRVNRDDALVWYKCVGTHRVTGSKVQSHADFGTGLKGAQIILTDTAIETKPRSYFDTASIWANQGEAIRLVCATQGTPTANKFKWSVNDRNLPDETSDVIEWIASSTEDDYVINCQASNSLGSARVKFFVSVKAPLRINPIPKVQNVDLGSPLSINCSFSGNPIKSLSWYLNGIEVKTTAVRRGQSYDVMKVDEAGIGSLGVYQCEIHDGDSSYVSATSEVQLKEKEAVILSSFEEKVYESGKDSVLLECQAYGNPVPYFEWYHNEQKILLNDEGSTSVAGEKFVEVSQVVAPFTVSSRLSMNPVELLDSGVFTCKAANQFGSAVVSNYLHVKGPPDVMPMPDRVVLATGVTQLPCYVAGHPIEQINWYHNGQKLPYTYRQTVASNGTLFIRDTANEDQGPYTCEAKGGGFIDSYSFKVTVKVGPQISAFQLEDSVLNERLGVVCSVTRGDTPIQINWFKDGKQIASGTDQFVVKFLPPTTSYLSIERIRPMHAGNYTCVASNQVASVSHTASLRVNIPPYFTEEPRDSAVLLGSRVELPCRVLGSPAPNVTWEVVPFAGQSFSEQYSKSSPSLNFKPISTIPAEERSNYYISKHNGSFIIRNVSLNVPRNLLCRAWNGIGREAAKSVQLILLVPPFFKHPNSNKSVRIGESSDLSCVAFGNKPLSIEWYRNGISLSDIKASISANYATQMTENENGTVSTMKIAKAVRSDSANYTCMASNAHGYATRTIIFKVLELPDAPYDVRVVRVNSSSAELKWTIGFNGNSPLDYIVMSYYQSGDDDDGKSIMSGSKSDSRGGDANLLKKNSLKLPPNSSKVKLSNLLPATHYKVTVEAVNSLGTSKDSPTVSVYTSEAAPTGPPVRFRLRALSTTSILVSWKQPEIGKRNGKITEYDIVYFNIADQTNQKIVNVAANHQNTMEFSDLPSSEFDQQYEVDKLDLFTSYDFKIRARTESGPGPFTTPAMVTTLEGVPSEAPANLEVTQSLDWVLLVKFDAIPQNKINGRLLGYKVKYFKKKEPNAVSFYPSLDRSILLSHMQPYTNYSISVCGYTQAGDGVYTVPLVVETKQAPPSAPEKTKVMLKSSREVLVSWLPPIHTRGVIKAYLVCFEKQTIVSRRGAACIEVTHAYREYVKSDVEVGSSYSVWVTAVNGAGEGDRSKVHQIAVTSGIVPPTIYSFSRTMTVTWRSDVVLDCQFVGSPTPTHSWKRSRDRNPKPLGVSVDGKLSDKFMMMRNHSLLIANAAEEDSGVYTCAIANLDQSDSINYTLTVLAPPKTPSVEVYTTTNSSIEIRWLQQNEVKSIVSNYVVHYRLKPTSSNWNDRSHPWKNVSIEAKRVKMQPVNLEGKNDFSGSFLATNLECGRKYEFYVSSKNAVGESEMKEVLNVKTDGSTPVTPEKDALVEELSPTSALLNLSAIKHNGCSIQSILIVLKEKQDRKYSNKMSSDEPSPMKQKASQKTYRVSGNRANFILSELKPATYYDLKLIANNSAGSSENVYTFATHTLSGVPLPDRMEEFGPVAPSLFANQTLIGVFGGAGLVSLFVLCLVLLCILKAIKNKRKQGYSMGYDTNRRHRTTRPDFPPELIHTLSSDRGPLVHLSSGYSHDSTSTNQNRALNFNRTNSLLQEMANNQNKGTGGSKNSLLAVALSNNGQIPARNGARNLGKDGPFNTLHATQPNLTQLRDAPDMPQILPEAANPMFLSHGNLALSLGLSGGPQGIVNNRGVPHGSNRFLTTQANSASNLNASAYTNQPIMNSIYNTYNSSPFAAQNQNSDPRQPSATFAGVGGSGLSSSLLQTFAAERGDDSGIDEDDGQSPNLEPSSRAGSTSGNPNAPGRPNSRNGSFIQKMSNGGVSNIVPGLSNSQPRLAFPTQPIVDSTRATLLKEELQKHMWMTEAASMVPQQPPIASVPNSQTAQSLSAGPEVPLTNPIGINPLLPSSISFQGNPLLLGIPSPAGSQSAFSINRPNSFMSMVTPNKTQSNAGSQGNLNGPPPVPPRDSAFDPGIPIVNKQPQQQQQQNGNKRGSNSNFSNGFRPIPGDTIPRTMASKLPQRIPPNPLVQNHQTEPLSTSSKSSNNPSNPSEIIQGQSIPMNPLLRNESNSSNKSLPGLYMQRQQQIMGNGVQGHNPVQGQVRNSTAMPPAPPPLTSAGGSSNGSMYFNPASLMRQKRPVSFALPNQLDQSQVFVPTYNNLNLITTRKESNA